MLIIELNTHHVISYPESENTWVNEADLKLQVESDSEDEEAEGGDESWTEEVINKNLCFSLFTENFQQEDALATALEKVTPSKYIFVK